MKATLTAADLEYLMGYVPLEVELDPSVFEAIGLKEAVEKVLQDDVTCRAGTLYQEIRKQVDEYLKRHLPCEVGNYVRTQDHTAQRIIRGAVTKEVESGIESGIRHFAKQKSEQIATALAAEGEPAEEKLRKAVVWLLDNLEDPVTPSRDFNREKKMEEIKALVGREK
jgi:hypothetical protein